VKTSTKTVLVTLLLGIPAFMTEPNGPLGSFWRPSPMVPTATGIQIPLFMTLGLAEGLALGLGVAFLLFGADLVRRAPVSPGLARAAQLAITWSLVNWWAHDSLHLHVGMDLNGLLGIEYGFHMTLIASGLIIAWYFINVVRAQPAAAGATSRSHAA
jgi:hypothetical protein